MASQHILVVEDEAKISDVLQDYLNKGGYSVTCLSRGDQVLPQIRRQMPDLILLDINLPGMDGTEVCREIRKHWSVSIIMITARVEEVDRILGLELGADDYICKPFSPREVVARVNAVLRRTHDKTDEKQIVVGPLFLDADRFQVEVAGQTVKLTGNEFTLLKTLMSRPDRVFSRAELLNRVQGYEYDGYDRTIDTHVKNLRKKIATALPDQELIVTVYGIGYKLTSTGT
jgi:two-component system response regulator BaeR